MYDLKVLEDMIHIANHDYKIVRWPQKMQGAEKGTVLSRLLAKGMKKTMENKVIVKCGDKRTYGIVAQNNQLQFFKRYPFEE